MSDYPFEPLPPSVRERLDGDTNTHPGLELDKYAKSWSDALRPDKLSELVQQPTVDRVVKISQKAPVGLNYQAMAKRRLKQIQALETGPSGIIKATTTGPLTLHLARSSALENAGICLHPIYGFAFLPGTGIKGMARAWAETVWLPAQPDQKAAWKKIEDIFGWSPSKDRRRQLKDDGHSCEPRKDEKGRVIEQSTGSVLFHDAWADEWPKLKSDILNSHHSKYYGGDENPPGDWENPIPVYFLTVARETAFSFAVSHRTRLDGNDPSKTWRLDLAEQFIIGALRYSGAGAKTAAGYGAFRIVESTQLENLSNTWNAAKSQNRRADFLCHVQLTTPGFLGGPKQYDPAGCDLREATLRGQLRWWWRTMHASWLTVDDLRRLEAAVWGNTDVSGAVRITVTPAKNNVAGGIPFDRRDVIYKSRLPKPGNRKTAQGLTYFSYGTDEKNGRRPYKPVGSQWQIEIIVRQAHLPDGKDVRLLDGINADRICRQAQASLWLLTQFGGVGAKGRKGFGSLKCLTDLKLSGIEACQNAASEFRQAAKLPEKRHQAESPSLDDDIIGPIEISLPWKDEWFAIDRVADAAQEFAQDNKHNLEKQALGLPRRIRQPFSGRFETGKRLNEKDPRHAAPLLYHFDSDGTGRNKKVILRIIGFPSTELPADSTAEMSRRYLRNAVQTITTYIETRKVSDKGGQKVVAAAKPAAPAAPGLPKVKDVVTAVLQEEKTRKGGWIAKHEESGLAGPIQNSASIPDDKDHGDEITLVVAICNGKQIAFRFDEKKMSK